MAKCKYWHNLRGKQSKMNRLMSSGSMVTSVKLEPSTPDYEPCLEMHCTDALPAPDDLYSELNEQFLTEIKNEQSEDNCDRIPVKSEEHYSLEPSAENYEHCLEMRCSPASPAPNDIDEKFLTTTNTEGLEYNCNKIIAKSGDYGRLSEPHDNPGHVVYSPTSQEQTSDYGVSVGGISQVISDCE